MNMDTILEQLIHESGLKKGFVAERAGMTRSRLSRLLHTERNPRLALDEASRIAGLLGVTPDAFLDGDALRMRKEMDRQHEALEHNRQPERRRRKAVA